MDGKSSYLAEITGYLSTRFTNQHWGLSMIPSVIAEVVAEIESLRKSRGWKVEALAKRVFALFASRRRLSQTSPLSVLFGSSRIIV